MSDSQIHNSQEDIDLITAEFRRLISQTPEDQTVRAFAWFPVRDPQTKRIFWLRRVELVYTTAVRVGFAAWPVRVRYLKSARPVL